MTALDLRLGEQSVAPEWLPSSDFANNVEYARALPEETEAWVLAAVNRVRDAHALPSLTAGELWGQLALRDHSMTDALRVPRVTNHPDWRVATTADLMTTFARVFGLAFAPATTTES